MNHGLPGSAGFRYLFTPLRIGPITVRNRILATAHATRFGKDHLPSERHLHYYKERSRGGIGLIIAEGAPVSPNSVRSSANILAYREEVIPAYRRIGDAVHRHGARIFVQLFHAGHHVYGSHFHVQAWAPSPIPSATFLEAPKAMGSGEIVKVVEGFVRSARNVKEAGLDGVEIHMGHFHLLHQFLSPLFNRRTDEYGGSLENRLRLTREVIEAVRGACDGNFAVGVRVNGEDLIPEGLTLEQMQEVLVVLSNQVRLDFVNVSLGGYHRLQHIMIAPMAVAPGFQVYAAAAIRRTLRDVPVFTVGRITDPLMAERFLADGYADMVGMTRATIADPELPNKARQGRLDDIRPCISCNQGCTARLYSDRPITCLINPTVGREKEWGIGTVRPAGETKRVMVVGGGPAGLEAARVAAARGHRVTLYEKEQQLGGQVLLAAKLPHREEFAESVRWLERQIVKLGVEIRPGLEVTPEMVQDVAADVVIVATGARPMRTGFSSYCPERPGIPGAEGENVVTAWDVLREEVELGGHVVLVDDDGHHVAAGTAEFLAERTDRLDVITRFPQMGHELRYTLEQDLVVQRLLEKGVNIIPHTIVEAIEKDRVVTRSIYTGTEKTIESVDLVVLAMGNKANDELYRALQGDGREVYAIGDCVAPRRALMAIFEGHQIGRQI